MDDFEIYELKKYEIIAYKAILQWEAKKENLPRKIIGSAAYPFNYVLAKIGQHNFETIEKVVAGTVDSLYRVAEMTVSQKRLLARLQKNGFILDDYAELKHGYLKPIDQFTRKSLHIHSASAVIQGGLAGFSGELLAPVDLSALLVRVFNMVQNIAFCYGFETTDPIEKQIMLCIIIIALSRSSVKNKILSEIAELREKQQSTMGPHYTQMLTSRASDKIVKKLAASLILRLFSRSVPIVSIVISAHSNYEIMSSSSDAAFMVYRKHFIERKKRLGANDPATA